MTYNPTTRTGKTTDTFELPEEIKNRPWIPDWMEEVELTVKYEVEEGYAGSRHHPPMDPGIGPVWIYLAGRDHELVGDFYDAFEEQARKAAERDWESHHPDRP